jgi:hypothetical protein
MCFEGIRCTISGSRACRPAMARMSHVSHMTIMRDKPLQLGCMEQPWRQQRLQGMWCCATWPSHPWVATAIGSQSRPGVVWLAQGGIGSTELINASCRLNSNMNMLWSLLFCLVYSTFRSDSRLNLIVLYKWCIVHVCIKVLPDAGSSSTPA